MAPQCRCYVVPILCTPEEMAQMQRNILAGNADANNGFHSANEVTVPPKVFTSWVKDNQERIARAKSLPYFLRDNGKVIDGEWVYGGKTKPIAQESVRKGMFGRRHKDNDISEELSIHDIPVFEMTSQRENTERFLSKLGYSEKAIRSIHAMPFVDADMGKANFANDIDDCQLCAPTLLARMRGVDVSAPFYSKGGFMEKLSKDMRLAFADSETLKPLSFTAKKANVKEMQEKLQRTIEGLPNNSIHNFGYDSRIDGKDGHIWTVLKTDGKTFIVDGQEKRGTNHSLSDIIPRIDFTDKVQLLRVDNLNFSDEFMDFFVDLKKKR